MRRCFAHIVQADIDHMTFRSGVFDVVLAEGDSLVQRERREDIEHGLREVHRVLRREGLLLGSVSNVYSRLIVKAVSTSNRGGLSKIVGIAEKKELVVKRRGFRESKIQLFTHEELKRLLEKVGFVNVRLNSILTTTHFLPKTFVKKNTLERLSS